MSELKITCLIDNKAEEGLAAEHGLSLLAAYGGKMYLLDSGSSGKFADNAKKLGVDLSTVDTAVLSHGHYDHGGGFGAFFDANRNAPVYARAGFRDRCFFKLGPVRHAIGVPARVLAAGGERFVTVTADRELAPGVHLLGHTTPGLDERGRAAHLWRQSAEGLAPDDFSHEQSLVFETQTGLVILNSCCHGGADTVVREALSALPGRPVAALIGGFHLMGALGVKSLGVKPEEAETLGRTLLELGVAKTYLCHCTGDPGSKILGDILGARSQYFPAGASAEF